MAETTKPKRKQISKKTRFEVFKRDGFTCQYCGRMAPDVILEVDHINPVANGGASDILNLVTSCKDCNRGKGKRTLSNNLEIKTQQEQIKDFAKKRDQLQMLIEWRQQVKSILEDNIDFINDIFSECAGVTLTETGRKIIAKEIKKYGIDEVSESTQIYIDSYFDEEENRFTRDFSTIGRICYNRKRQKDDPSIYWVNRIVYKIHNKFPHIDKWKIRSIVSGNVDSEEECEYILDMVDDYRSWSSLRDALMEEF